MIQNERSRQRPEAELERISKNYLGRDKVCALLRLIPTRNLVRSAEGPHRTVGRHACKQHSYKYEGIDESPKGAWKQSSFSRTSCSPSKGRFQASNLPLRRITAGADYWIFEKTRGAITASAQSPHKTLECRNPIYTVSVLEPLGHLDFDFRVKTVPGKRVE